MDVLNFFLIVTAIVSALLHSSQAQGNEILRCKSYGEPHFLTWHSENTLNPTSNTCVGNHMFKLVHNRYVDFDVKVIAGYGVDVTVNFLDGAGTSLCLANTSNFNFYVQPHCSMYNIIATLIKTSDGETLTLKHPEANFLAIVIHTNALPRQYTIEMFQPRSLMLGSEGQCSKADCFPTRSLLNEPAQPAPRQTITKEQARDICEMYSINYLNTIHRSPVQRSAYFNSTIRQTLEECIYDVRITGEPAAAAKGIEILMIQDLIDGATNIDEIESHFNAGVMRSFKWLNKITFESLLGVHRRYPKIAYGKYLYKACYPNRDFEFLKKPIPNKWTSSSTTISSDVKQ
ncbi:unnamed protein product [Rotaria socialis]|uniref:Uncharacterized protein n=1 Tax=Rotaria socialis TaxID=392032 RepID=A0A821CH50_9BILA|nr:unnamed protein product [Rotaria socialis]